jgi:hypothetical protein
VGFDFSKILKKAKIIPIISIKNSAQLVKVIISIKFLLKLT